MRRPLLLSLAFLAACTPPKQVVVPDVLVAQTADTVIVPVVNIADAIPLSDERWVVLATEERELQIADFTTRKTIPFPGMTKAEVPGPTRLIASGDTVFVSDWGLRRTTSWLISGKRLSAWPVPDALNGSYPRTRDAAGQWYFDVPPAPGPDGSGQKDSIPVVRSDPLMTHFDTLAMLVPPEIALSGPNGNQWVRRALGGQDGWGVYPDGGLWIARVFQNQVEWRRSGVKQVTRSPLFPDPVRMVQEMDRQIYLRRFPEANRTEVSMRPFAGTKPPFERAIAAPDHRIWLFKSGVALDSVRAFQVVDSTGLKALVRVPSRGMVLALNAKYIIMSEEFPGGIRLLRYQVPKEAVENK